MSLWFYGKKRDGRRSLYSVSVPIYTLPILIGMVVAVLFGLIEACR